MPRRPHRTRLSSAALLAGIALVGGAMAPAGAIGPAATTRQLAGSIQNPFAQPVALVKVGSSLFVLDANAVVRWDLSTSTFSSFAGKRKAPGSTDGAGAAARFNGPQGITTDGTDLYVADTGNHTIRKVVVATKQVTTIAGGAGLPGSANGIGTAARFNQPWGIATGNGTALWIADRANFTVRKLLLATGEVTTRAGTAGMSGSVDGVGAAARFVSPLSVVTGGSGRLYLTDGDKVRMVRMGTGEVSTVASLADPNFVVVGTGIAAAGDYLFVAALYDDQDDDTFTAVKKVTIASGAITSFSLPSFREATGLAVNGSASKLFVTGHGDFFPTFLKAKIATQTASDLGAFNLTGYVDATGVAARFDFARDVASDDTTLYVSDPGNHAVRKVDIGSGAVSTLATGLGFFASGITIVGGNLYLGDSNKVKKVVIATGAVSTVATLGSGTVNDVTVAGSDLYVVFSNCALYKIPIATGTPTVFAGAAGSCGSADGTGTAARFGADVTCPACPPQGITNDGTNLYVADHMTVRKVAIATAAVTTLTSVGPPFDPQLDITVAAGQLYVARTNIVTLPTTGGTVTDVTASDNRLNPLDYTARPAAGTYVAELQGGLAASSDGHQVYFATRTGVGVIED